MAVRHGLGFTLTRAWLLLIMDFESSRMVFLMTTGCISMRWWHNKRNWRSEIAKEHFKIPVAQQVRPGENPALNLPHNQQLVGAVFVECARPSRDTDEQDLIPAMDREGLLDNQGSAELREYVCAGIEFLALCDKNELLRREQIEARRAAKKAAGGHSRGDRGDRRRPQPDRRTRHVLSNGTRPLLSNLKNRRSMLQDPDAA